MPIAILILFFILIVVACSFIKPSGRNASVLWHDMNGEYRVIYPDGKKSQRFTREVAQDYRDIFGGTVVKAEKYNATTS
jgi:hypothetical protein